MLAWQRQSVAAHAPWPRAAAGSSARPIPGAAFQDFGARVGDSALEALDLLLPTLDGIALVHRQEGQVATDEFLHPMVDGRRASGSKREPSLVEEGIDLGFNVLRIVGSPPALRWDRPRVKRLVTSGSAPIRYVLPTTTESNCDCSQKSPQITAAGRFEIFISTPMSAKVCCTNCCTCSRSGSPAVVELVKERRNAVLGADAVPPFLPASLVQDL